MHRFARFSALAAVAGLLAGCAGTGTPSVPATGAQGSLSQGIRPAALTGQSIPSRTMAIDGLTVHVLPARGVAVLDEQGLSRLARASGSTNLNYGGGSVQTTPKIYIVYWGSKWTSSDPEYKILNGFMSAIGGGGWLNTVTQYYQIASGTTTYIGNAQGQLAGTWIDPSSVPRRPSSSNVGAEAQRAASHFGYGGVNANYIVAIQTGNDPSGFRTSWCAWHSSESESEGVVSFTNLPYQSDAGYSCGAGSVNSPGTYDGVTIVGGHEEAETQTDPQPSTGWVDGSGSEIGDKCAWTNLEDNPNAGGYPTQPLWDNKISGCAQSGP